MYRVSLCYIVDSTLPGKYHAILNMRTLVGLLFKLSALSAQGLLHIRRTVENYELTAHLDLD